MWLFLASVIDKLISFRRFRWAASIIYGFPGGSDRKQSHLQFKRVWSLGREDPLRRTQQPAPIFCLENARMEEPGGAWPKVGSQRLEWLPSTGQSRRCQMPSEDSGVLPFQSVSLDSDLFSWSLHWIELAEQAFLLSCISLYCALQIL